MARYMITSPHSSEKCLQALDDIAGSNTKLLDNCWFGCAAGDHTGWAIIDAKSETEAMNWLPTSLRDTARVVKVERFSTKQIREFHKKVA